MSERGPYSRKVLEPPAILKELGNCSNGKADTSIFYPVEGFSYQKGMVQFCSTCPVRRECGEWAVEASEYGLWGGMTDEDRQIVRRHRRLGPKPWPTGLEHGGPKKYGFTAHLKQGELPCDECHEGWTSNYPRMVVNIKGNK